MIISVLILFILILIFSYNYYYLKLNKKFYNANEINYDLNNIYKYNNEILQEVNTIKNKYWIDWPEKELYNQKIGKWNIFPFYAFNIWAHDNCRKCPSIYKFLKNLKGLKLATLSRMTPGLKLEEHQGWAMHSNFVIRCHFGIIVPEKCYISVSDEYGIQKKFHKNNEWLIFDDSKNHYAHNNSNEDRIVLIVDVERPTNVNIGKSTVGDTSELMNIVNYFKNKNKFPTTTS